MTADELLVDGQDDGATLNIFATVPDLAGAVVPLVVSVKGIGARASTTGTESATLDLAIATATAARAFSSSGLTGSAPINGRTNRAIATATAHRYNTQDHGIVQVDFVRIRTPSPTG